MHRQNKRHTQVTGSSLARSAGIQSRGARRHSALALCLTVGLAMGLSGCGGPDFDAVKSYGVFLESAKEPLQKMNRVREELFQLNDPNEMVAKFKDDLLPAVKKLSKLAEDHETPGVQALSEIHVTLRNVLKDYTENTTKLVEALELAKQNETAQVKSAKGLGSPESRIQAENAAHTTADRAREQALVTWGEADQKFGSKMQNLVDSLTKYLDKQLKR